MPCPKGWYPTIFPSLLPAFLLLHKAVGAVDPPVLAGEAEAVDTGMWEPPAARAGGGDGEPDAAILQPASIAAIQLGELPRGIELPHFGHGSPVVAARLCRLLEVQVAPDEVDVAWGWGERGK